MFFIDSLIGKQRAWQFSVTFLRNYIFIAAPQIFFYAFQSTSMGRTRIDNQGLCDLLLSSLSRSYSSFQERQINKHCHVVISPCNNEIDRVSNHFILRLHSGRYVVMFHVLV